MSFELIIFSALLVVSVIMHLFFWRDSKKRYTNYLMRLESLNKRIVQLEEDNEKMEKMLNDAEKAIERIDEETEEVQSGMILKKEKQTFEN